MGRVRKGKGKVGRGGNKEVNKDNKEEERKRSNAITKYRRGYEGWHAIQTGFITEHPPRPPYLLPGAMVNGGEVARLERGDEESDGFENGSEFGESMARERTVAAQLFITNIQS